MPPLSLRWRLSLAFAAALCLLLALDVGLTALGAGRRVAPEIADATELTTDVLRGAVASLVAGPNLERQLTDLAASLDRLRHVRVAFRPEGAASPASERPRGDAPPEWFAAWLRPAVASTEVEAVVEGRRRGVFVVTGDPDDEIGEIWESVVTLALDGAAVAAIGLAVVFLVVRAAFRPLDRVNAGLAALGAGDYRARVAPDASPEFQPLIARFNALGDKLEAAERENRGLRGKLVSIQDEERKDIARELHDEIGPHLFAARAQAVAARRAAGEGPALAAIDALVRLIDALQQTNRRILERLRPVALEELGLDAALAALGRFFAREELAVEVESEAPPGLPEDLEAAIYRLAQEALTNVARHAGARHARVELLQGADGLALVVEDDGRGLDPAAPPGRGLIGMRERALAQGGALTLTPRSPCGLRVRATFPLKPRLVEGG